MFKRGVRNFVPLMIVSEDSFVAIRFLERNLILIFVSNFLILDDITMIFVILYIAENIFTSLIKNLLELWLKKSFSIFKFS
jgi:hypothetical protein